MAHFLHTQQEHAMEWGCWNWQYNPLPQNMWSNQAHGKDGDCSQAQRALVYQEFEQIIEMATNYDSRYISTWLAAYNVFQYIMTASVDDTVKLSAPDLQP